MVYIYVKTWNKLYSKEKLLESVLKLYEKSLFYKSKSYSTWIDEETLYDFASDSSKRLNQLHKKLKTQTFQFSPIYVKTVRFWGKERNLHIESWEDKIVNSMLFNMLNIIYSKEQSQFSFAYKHKSGGVDACQRAIIKYIKHHNCQYFIKRDIKNYFPSINHQILINKLDIKDDYLNNLILERIKFDFVLNNDPKIRSNIIGIPFGTPIACFLANWYLSELDKKFENINVGYFRYADDFLIASPTQEKALEGMHLLDGELNKLQLISKESHAHQYSFETSNEIFQKVHGFKHLGLLFKSDYKIGLSKDKLLKIRNLFLKRFKKNKNKLKKIKSLEDRIKFLINLSNESLEYIKPTAVIDYYLKHLTDESQLVDLDRWLAEEVLARATGKGHKKGNFRHMSFKKMRKLGLPSLVHRRRLIKHGHIKSDFFQLRNSKLTERWKKSKEPQDLHHKQES